MFQKLSCVWRLVLNSKQILVVSVLISSTSLGSSYSPICPLTDCGGAYYAYIHSLCLCLIESISVSAWRQEHYFALLLVPESILIRGHTHTWSSYSCMMIILIYDHHTCIHTYMHTIIILIHDHHTHTWSSYSYMFTILIHDRHTHTSRCTLVYCSKNCLLALGD